MRVDSSENQGGATWNWGYDADSQHDPAASVLDYHISEGLADSSVDEDNARHHGFEVTWDQPLATMSGGWFGLHFSLGYNRIDFHNDTSLPGNISQLTDSFQLNGVIPPLAPYRGSFDGPGPLLSDAPARRISRVAGGSLISAG